MESKFKVGDKVRCIEGYAFEAELATGKEYEVESVGRWVHLKGVNGGHGPWRFQHVTSAPTPNVTAQTTPPTGSTWSHTYKGVTATGYEPPTVAVGTLGSIIAKTAGTWSGEASFQVNGNCPSLREVMDAYEARLAAGKEDDEPPAATFRKDDSGKSRVDLIAPAFLEELGHVLRIGAEKYGASNWCKGAAWSRYIGAALRHTLAFMRGEDKDECGYSHLACAAASLMFLFEYGRRGLGEDDRSLGG